MTRRLSKTYTWENYLAAGLACDRADIVVMTYPGGEFAVKGEALLREIKRSGRAREVAIAEVDVRDLGEAKAIRDLLARAAA